jgi:hypothetical protein
MGLIKRRDKTPRSVVAASLPLSGPNALLVSRSVKPGSEDWQKEAWYHYDACGEFRSAVTWIANAVSQADVFAAEVDPESGTVGGPTEDSRAQRAAMQVLGGMEHRAQMLKTLAVHWQVPGESYLVVRPRKPVKGVPQPDEWLALSGSKVTYKGGTWQYTDPYTMLPVDLDQATGRLIRVWSPHPNDGAKADSAARPSLPILREIEKASMNISSRLDSRMAGNGILWIPSEMEFPRDDGQSLGEAFSEYLLEAAEASIKNPGVAAAQVPVTAVAPGEMISQAQHMDLATEFDASVGEIRDNALARLWRALDMPNETAEGSTSGMNHWGAWQVEESTYKIYIRPLLEALGDAITLRWFRDTLRAMGESDPDRFVLQWETSSIVSRPDRTGELKDLWDDVLISDEYRLAEQGIPDDAIPGPEEKRRRELYELVKVAPALLADPQIGRELFGFEIAPAAVSVDPGAAEVSAGDEAPAPALPAGPTGRPDQTEDVPEGLVAAAELIVYDALSRAGGRLLTRPYRGQFGTTPKHELHTVIPVSEVDPLLEGSFTLVDRVAEGFRLEPVALTKGLRTYVRYLLATQEPHDPVMLRDTIRQAIR